MDEDPKTDNSFTNSGLSLKYDDELVHERRQAALRLLLGGLILLFMAATPIALVGLPLTISAIVCLLLPLLLWLGLKLDDRQREIRRILGLLTDISMATVALYLGGGITAPLVLLYQWIIFDYSRKYGKKYLHWAIALSGIFFTAPLLFNEFWFSNGLTGILLLTTFGLPLLYQHKPEQMDQSLDSALSPEVPVVESTDATPQLPDDAHTTEQDKDNLQGKRILVVSNDIEDRHSIDNHLISWGVVTVKCENAALALHALIEASQQGRPFHSVIVDHDRVGMDDAQFAQVIRSDTHLQGLYLIHIGFDPNGLQQDRLLAAGYTRLLPTPLSKTLLFDALHNTYVTPEPNARVVRLIDHVTARTGRQPLSILIADDEFSVRQRLMAMLKKAGHRVFMVNNGARVLDALDSHRFDIALISTNLKEISGLEAFKLYRFTRVDKQWTPFALVVDEADDRLLERCKDAGISATIDRDADPAEFLDLVDKVVSGHNSETSISSSFRNAIDAGNHSLSLENGNALDTKRLMEIERLGGGPRLLSDLIDSFNRDNRRILTEMREAAEKHEVRRFCDLGHALKDGAGSLGTIKLFKLATAATRMTERDFPETAPALLQEITECCRLSNNALHAYLLGQGPTESDNFHD